MRHALAVVPELSNLAKDEIREKFLAGERPADLARKYEIPLPQLRGWINAEAWEIQRADFAVNKVQATLDRLGIKGKEDLCFGMYKDLLALQQVLSKKLSEAAKAGKVATLKDIIAVMRIMNDLDEKIQTRLGLI